MHARRAFQGLLRCCLSLAIMHVQSGIWHADGKTAHKHIMKLDLVKVPPATHCTPVQPFCIMLGGQGPNVSEGETLHTWPLMMVGLPPRDFSSACDAAFCEPLAIFCSVVGCTGLSVANVGLAATTEKRFWVQ